MKTDLAISTVACMVPKKKLYRNCCGSEPDETYKHLRDKAGVHSRPISVIPSKLQCQEYSAPTAKRECRVSDLAAEAVEQCLSHCVEDQDIKHVFHAQCTLDQQITASTCLQLMHEHFLPEGNSMKCTDAVNPVTIGQLSTCALPTAFILAHHVKQKGAVCISASDKWQSPFIRHIPGVVTYADAGAACFLGSSESITNPIATVEAVVTVCQPTNAFSMWSTDKQEHMKILQVILTDCLKRLKATCSNFDNSVLLIGDQYKQDIIGQISSISGLQKMPAVSKAPIKEVIHFSSSSMLFGIQEAIQYAVDTGTDQRVAIWTACATGCAGIALVRCSPRARKTNFGWTSAN